MVLKPEDDDALLQTFKGWFKQIQDVEADQRQRENEDLRFQVGEYQWDEKARRERLGDPLAATAGRPTLSISLTKQPMQLVKNQAAAADLGVEIHPVSEQADKEVAEIKQGIYRRIERDSNAEQVRLWALDRAVQCGRGWYQVVMQYDEHADHEYDQEIIIKRVLDGNCVGIDPSAQEPDYSDAHWAYLDEWMSYEAYCDEYQEAPLDQTQFAELASREPDWATDRPDKRAVRVPQVWRKKHKRTTVCLVKEGKEFVTVPLEEVGRRKKYATRVRDDVTLCWYRITATRILERQEYEGLRLIPLIPVPGNELQPFDGERRFEGMVRPARDGQRAFNYGISSAVEDVGRLSKIPYVGPAGAFTGFEAKWNTLNTRNYAFVEYNRIGSDGQPIEKPEPMQIDGTKLGLSLQLSEMAKGLVQAATAVYDPSLGETPKKGQSGRAVIAQQQQADAGTSNYLQNLANISMRYESRVIDERMPYVYDRPGRITEVLGAEDEVKQVMLNAPYNVQDGRPVRVVSKDVQGAKLYDLRRGKYSTSVSVGKSYQTRLQQGQEEFGQLLQNLPPELQVLLLPTYMRFRDSPGSKEAADLMAKFRDAKFPGLVDDKDQAPTPEQLQAQVQGQQQKMQEMGQQLQMAIQEIKTDQAKQQAMLAKAQLDAQAMLEKARMDNAARIEVARIGAAKQAANQEAEAQEELLATGIKVKAEAEQGALDRDHERQMQHEKLAHEVGMAAAGGSTMTMHREGGQEADQEQGQETGTQTTPKPTESEA